MPNVSPCTSHPLLLSTNLVLIQIHLSQPKDLALARRLRGERS